jgi:hypothetical protein
VEIPRELEPTLDVTIPDINADDVHAATQPPYPPGSSTGAGVVVGIVDTGIDYNHGDFKNGSTSRITRIWDQTDGAGPAASGFGYGSEWTQAQIEAGTARERDNDGHGTHVTGIAAGNGSASGYVYTGTAPEAEIMFVKTDFLEDSIIDAVSWVQVRAGSKPSVVNLSLGSQFGPHDGTGDLDLAMNALSGPGAIIVAAAGNDRDSDIHAEAVVSVSATQEFDLVIPNFNNDGIPETDLLFLDGWYPGNRSFTELQHHRLHSRQHPGGSGRPRRCGQFDHGPGDGPHRAVHRTQRRQRGAGGHLGPERDPSRNRYLADTGEQHRRREWGNRLVGILQPHRDQLHLGPLEQLRGQRRTRHHPGLSRFGDRSGCLCDQGQLGDPERQLLLQSAPGHERYRPVLEPWAPP